MHYKEKAVAVIHTKKGILLVSMYGDRYGLPGGKSREGEQRIVTAIRESFEETNLRARNVTYLFDYTGNLKREKGEVYRNRASVFLIEASGTPRPRNEIKYHAYFKPNNNGRGNCNVDVTPRARKVIKKYLENFV